MIYNAVFFSFKDDQNEVEGFMKTNAYMFTCPYDYFFFLDDFYFNTP